MKTNIPILLVYILFIFYFSGCEAGNDVETETIQDEQFAFTSISTRSANDDPLVDEYGNEYSGHNLIEVPDEVGAFVEKIGGNPPSGFIIENAIYRLSKFPSDNFLLTGNTIPTHRPGGTPSTNEEQLFWYKTTHPHAYWDKTPGAEYNIYAYAPIVEDNINNSYYTITNDGIIEFQLDKDRGISVDFIYAKETNLTRINDSEKLHMLFKHKLSKMVFKLRNKTENAITCYGVKYKIEYPTASFDLIDNKWFFGGAKDTVEVKRYAQYEIFSESEIALPELTTLLFPTQTSNLKPGSISDNVVVEFQVCLNNKWYDMTGALEKLMTEDPNFEYTEGKLIELTFDCKLSYGVDDWNIFVATFDSFEEGDPINGTLK